MKRFLLVVVSCAVTPVHADWPFYKVKKAVPISAEEKASLEANRNRVLRIKALKEELIKSHPGSPAFQDCLDDYEKRWMNDPQKLEECFLSFINAKKFDDEIKAIQHVIFVSRTTEQLKGAMNRLNELKRYGTDNGTERMGRNEILQTKMIGNARADELKKSEEAAYCLAHYKTATTPEDIEASIPHCSWFAIKGMSDMDFERNRGMTKEAYDADFKKTLLSMSKEQRIEAIENMFSLDVRVESDPGYRQLKAKEERSEQMAMQSQMVLNSSKQVEAAREANMNAAEANSIAQKAAMQQHWDAQEAINRQHLDSLQQESLNSYHSGTIQFDNGHTATYQGN